MCHPPRLGAALLATCVALATTLIDGSGTLSLEYLPPQPLTQSVIHPRPENRGRNGGFPDHPSSVELDIRETGGQHTEDLEELALAFLADKLRASVEDGGHGKGGTPDRQRPATLQDNDLEELLDGMMQVRESGPKNRLTREVMDIRNPDMTKQLLGEQETHLANCRSGRLDWPPCALFDAAITGLEARDTVQEVLEEDDVVVPGSDEDADDQTPGTRRKRDTEISRSTRQESQSQSHVLPSKIRKGFSAWGGKRAPPFGSWGGKRSPDFHSWGGKRAGGSKSYKKQMSNPSAWEGKRVPAFHSWGGKRAPSFNSWGGKRAPSFNSWGGKRAPSFNSWGGKRAPSFNSWGGKRAPSFNSWGGKRAPSFNSWGGKRAPSFNSWGGKRAPSFNSWGGKRVPSFNSLDSKGALDYDSTEDQTIPLLSNWDGKRAPFNSWGGKRAFEYLNEKSVDGSGEPMLILTDDSQLSEANEVENGVSDAHVEGPWVDKWGWAAPRTEKEKASGYITQNKPPEK